MTSIFLNSIIGLTYPYDVYVCDVYGNNCGYLVQINVSVPSPVEVVLPSQFNMSPAVGIKIITSDGCERFKIIDCNVLLPTPTPTPTTTVTPTPTITPTVTKTPTPTPIMVLELFGCCDSTTQYVAYNPIFVSGLPSVFTATNGQPYEVVNGTPISGIPTVSIVNTTDYDNCANWIAINGGCP